LRADGSEVPIRGIRVGDKLLAFTPDGEVVRTNVRNILTHEVDEYLEVVTERTLLRVTVEHPFYVGEGTFKTLEALNVGDSVYAYDGHGLSAQKIISITHIRGRTRVYNLQTDTPNTFFANSVAVHNKGGGGGEVLEAVEALEEAATAEISRRLLWRGIGPGPHRSMDPYDYRGSDCHCDTLLYGRQSRAS